MSEPQRYCLDPRDILNLSLLEKYNDRSYGSLIADLLGVKNVLPYLSEPQRYSHDPTDILKRHGTCRITSPIEQEPLVSHLFG